MTVAPSGRPGQIFGSWLSSHHWGDRDLTYSFPAGADFYEYVGRTPVAPLTVRQQYVVETLLAEISSFTRLTFTKITETEETTAVLRFARDTSEKGGYTYLPSLETYGGDGFYGSNTLGPVAGNEAYLYFLHEIGHALGLGHGHESDSFASSPYNSQEFTVMTYTDYIGDLDTLSYDSGEIDWAQSYQQFDMAALQYLYGANYSADGEIWSGRTVYSFDPLTGEMSVNGIGQGVPAGNRIFRTIWDGHGRDTYDLSAFGSGVDVDLQPGAFSLLSAEQLADLNRFDPDPSMLARGNIANARAPDGDLRALIENAIGGEGDDRLAGNVTTNRLEGCRGEDLLVGRGGDDRLFGGRHDDRLLGGKGADRLLGGPGDDVLRGGAGNDILRGAAGRDVFIFDASSGGPRKGTGDLIEDFQRGLDRIKIVLMSEFPFDLRLGGSLGEGPAVATRSHEAGQRIRVDFDGDGKSDLQIIVAGAERLSADDFIF